jgi:hypothetical protein
MMEQTPKGLKSPAVQTPMDILRSSKLSLLVLSGQSTIFESNKNGINPLLEAISVLGRLKLRGTTVVDKVVGKAAALLLAYVRPKVVYCGIISQRAEEILAKYGILFYAEQSVPEICRPGSDELCPFEESVINVESPVQGYRNIVLRLFSLSESK